VPSETMNVEARGRKHVELGLLGAGIMSSIPEYDDGVDLIASLDWSGRFVARSIQIKAVSDYSLMTDRRYRARPGMMLVPVGPARNVAHLYARMADAIHQGKRFDPDFDHAVALHELLEAAQRSSDARRAIALGAAT
jgi:hypothetical protein